MTFHDGTELGDVRAWLQVQIWKGAKCPCCLQTAKVYPRKVSGQMAAMLIRMYRAGRLDYVNLPALRTGQGGMDQTVMQHFGLIEEEKKLRPDGGRAGWWRVTPKGERFLLGADHLPKYARIYNNVVLRFDGPLVSIYDALGSRFDYRELMDA